MQGKTGEQWGVKTIEGKIVGRNNVIVPPSEVEDLAALGCNNKEIYTWFGITEGALMRNFAEELEKGRNRLKQSLRRAMLQNACVNLQPAIQIFLAKNILSMSDSPFNTEADQPLPWTASEPDEESQDQNTINNEESQDANS